MDLPMNKKTSRKQAPQPARKTLPAAVHAAALAQGGDDGAVTDTPLVVENAAGTAAPAPAPAKPEKPGKPATFSVTLPAGDAHRFDTLRHAHQAGGAKLKKSTLVRAALVALAELDQERVAQIIAGLQIADADQPKPNKAKSKK
jgi:hypothetical protein